MGMEIESDSHSVSNKNRRLPDDVSARRRRRPVRSELNIVYAFLVRNFHLSRRYLSWEIVNIFYSIINAMTIGLIGYEVPAATRGSEVLYLVIGALLWGFLSILFDEVANSIGYERWEGTIEYTFMAPIRRLTHLLGTCFWGVSYGVLRTIVVLIVVALFFHLPMHNANLPAAIVVLLISSLSFMGLGLIAAVLPLLSTERGVQATHIIQGIILLISGVYYPITVLPHWAQWMAWLSPATYALQMTRAALLHHAGFGLLWKQMLELAGIGILLIPVGLAIFMTAERYAMRTGRLKRNG
ncbi:ABC transporter permease [Alicyclobacillus cycloheptanicus]|uniref:Transport permease protein n=2 Tax=Alicyclobacillus cycloheptanicus TaxID=1457 RepID=A0ABT9XLB8_9BACL|nr:ABC transporter permease [Alicyclobacillus cycloheptanicus]MDQ0190910.1 ABC-2 type transport system permease protein [Alicyclobacillus cycloheptanicus]WDM01794.1 ABC transporter permease [Alicyclobacillus cycloheptanicus]